MKLNNAQISQALHQIDAEAIPEDHPVVAQLERIFGDHTYFIDGSGLNIVEPAAPDPAVSGALALVVNIASWTDSATPELVPHEPEATDQVVRIGDETQH